MTEDSAETVSLVVPSHPKYLYVVRSALYPIVAAAGFTKRDARRMILAVDEACSNIIKHAYGNDTKKTISIVIQNDREHFTVTLRDYGKKPDMSTIAPRDLEDVRPGGLGTHFMAAAFDQVRYDTGEEQGTLLTLIKKKMQVKA